MKKYLKVPLIATFAILCLFLLWIGSAFKSENKAKEALVYFQEGEVEKSYESLDAVRESLPPSRYHLYRAYLFLDQEEINQALSELDRAEQTLDEAVKDKERIALEIYLLKALTAYEQNDLDAMQVALNQAEAVNGDNNRYLDLRGLWLVETGDFQEAAKVFEMPAGPIVLTDWFESYFRRSFSENWEVPYVAFLELNQGNIEEARDQLNQIDQEVLLPKERSLYQMVDAYSYLFEGLAMPGTPMPKWINLAAEKLEGVQIEQEAHPFLKEELARTLEEFVKRTLTLKTWNDVPPVMDSFEKLGLRQGEQTAEQLLIDHFQTVLEEGDDEDILALADVLYNEIDRPAVRQEVVRIYEQGMRTKIREGELKGLERYWDSLKRFSQDTEAVSNRLEDFVLSRIFIVIQRELPFEDKVKPYLDFWRYIEPKGSAQKDMAIEMVNFGSELWDQSADMRKASDIFRMALEFAPFSHRDEVKSQIAFHLSNLHQKASEDDRLEELGLIYLLSNQLEIDEFKSQEKIALANVLADAEFYLSRGDQEEALKRIYWVERVDPENERGIKLLGFIRFREENYREAVETLGKSQNPDSEALGLIALSYFKLGQFEEGKKALRRIPEGKKLWAEIHKQVAYLNLIDGNPQKAKTHFDKMNRFSEKALIARMYAEKEAGEYEAALRTYLELPENTKRLRGVQFILIETLAGRGSLNDAEKGLEEMIKDESAFPRGDFERGLFNEFYNDKIETLTLNAFAGKFYKVYAKDSSKALEYFNRESRLPPKLVLEKADALFDLGKVEEAEAIFKEIEVTFQNQPQVFANLLLSLSEIVGKQQRYGEQKKYLEQLLERDPDSLKAKKLLAKAELNLGNLTTARNLYQALENERKLSAWERLDYLRTLLATGRFSEGGQFALNLQTFEMGFNRLYRLHVLDLAFPFINRTELKNTLLGMKLENEQLDNGEKQMFFSLSWKLGQKDQALFYLKDLSQQEISPFLLGIKQISEGKVSLGTQSFYTSLQNEKIGSPITDMIFSLDPIPSYLSARKNKAISKALKYSKSDNLMVDTVLALLDLKEYAPGSFTSSDQEILEQNLSKIEGLESVNAIVGRARYAYLFKKSDAIEKVLIGAISFDPTNTLLWKYLAKHYQANEQWALAKDAWTFAIKYFPENPVYFQKLAVVAEKLNDDQTFQGAIDRLKEIAPELLK